MSHLFSVISQIFWLCTPLIIVISTQLALIPLIGAAVLAACTCSPSALFRFAGIPTWMSACGLLLVYGWCSALWSGHSALSIQLACKLTGIMALLFIIYRDVHTPLWHVSVFTFDVCAIYAILIAALYMVLSHVFFPQDTVRQSIQSGLFMTLCFWIALGIVFSSNRFATSVGAWGSVLACGLALHTAACDTTSAALILSVLISTLLYHAKGHKCLRILQSLIIAAFITAPVICFYATTPALMHTYTKALHDPSYLHRLYIWRHTAMYIAEKPFLGYGLNASRAYKTPPSKSSHLAPQNTHFELFYTDKKGKLQSTKAESMGLHPHNIALQLWFELGVFGALLGGTIVALIFGTIYRITCLKKRSAAFGMFTSAMTVFWINLGTFQSWWLVCIVLAYWMFEKAWHTKRPMHEI